MYVYCTYNIYVSIGLFESKNISFICSKNLSRKSFKNISKISISSLPRLQLITNEDVVNINPD